MFYFSSLKSAHHFTFCFETHSRLFDLDASMMAAQLHTEKRLVDSHKSTDLILPLAIWFLRSCLPLSRSFWLVRLSPNQLPKAFGQDAFMLSHRYVNESRFQRCSSFCFSLPLCDRICMFLVDCTFASSFQNQFNMIVWLIRRYLCCDFVVIFLHLSLSCRLAGCWNLLLLHMFSATLKLSIL
jgi:hypothetical protein